MECLHRRSEVGELQRRALFLFCVLYHTILTVMFMRVVDIPEFKHVFAFAFFTEMLTIAIPGKEKIGLYIAPTPMLAFSCHAKRVWLKYSDKWHRIYIEQ